MSDAPENTQATAPLPSTVTDNPYVGPRTFERNQAHLFFGREHEAEALFSRVVSQRLVLFYAQSGAGKSSLINTQLIPKLEAANFVVLPVGRVGGDLLGGVDEPVDNIYLFNLMLSLDQSERDPARLAQLTLPHFLAHLTSEDGTRWYYEEAEAEEKTIDAQLAPLSGQAPNYVLIIDQFEEIITTHGNRWRERAEFFRQLEAAMVADPTLWAVLTLREDFVASLDPYAPLLSDNLRARYYMQRMRVEAARQAISRPAEARQRRFQPAAIDLLLNNLSQVRVAGKAGTESGQYIEPVQLQVVCYQLWEGLKNRFAPLISTEDVQKAGDVDRALASFYEETIAAALQTVPLAGGERRLRRWFEEKLLTEAGTRGTVYQGEQETAGLPNELVLALANRFLLRSEARSGGRWVELTHDRFVEPIREANRTWEAKQNNPLAAVTRLWLDNGRDPVRLLRGPQLLDAQTFAAEQGNLLRQAERDFLAASAQAAAAEQARLIEANRQAELTHLQNEATAQQRRTRNLWRVVTVVTALALIALIATGWAFQQRSQAIGASREAQTQANLAAIAEARAQIDKDAAVQAKTTADAARGEAQTQAVAAATAQAEAEAANAQTKQLRKQIEADRMAQIASLTHINKSLLQYPQRALLLAIEAARVITPPVPSSLTTLHDLLGRTGGVGFSNHEGAVTSVAFAPDGQTLASSSDDNTIRLWSLAEPDADPVVLTGHAGAVTSVAFAPDGQTLASGSADGMIRLWSLAQPSADPVVLTGHAGAVTSVAFTPDGQTLASGSWNNTIRLWSLAELSADPVVLIGHTDYVYSVAFAPDGQTLASGSRDNTIRLWSLAEPSADPVVLTGHADYVYSVAFAPDGQTLASGSNDSTIRLWSLAQPDTDPVVLTGYSTVYSVAFAPDGQTLASGSWDNTIRLWSLAEPSANPVVLIGHDSYVTSVAFAPDGQTLASGSDDSTIRLWPLAQPDTDPVVLTGYADYVYSVAYAPNGQTLASGSDDGTIRLWSLAEPSADPVVLTGHDAAVRSVAFAPDGQTLASGSDDNTIRLWSLAEPSADPVVLTGHDAAVNSVAFAPDGQTLASGSDDSTIRLWSLAEPSADPVVLTGHADYVYSVAYAPNGQTLASGSNDNTIRLWSLAEPDTDPVVLTGHDAAIRSVAFAPDGQTLASGSWDKTIRLWSLAEPDTDPVVLTGHDADVNSVAFAPDGQTLASGSWDNTIRLWSLAQPDANPIVFARYGAVNSMAFAPDGQTLASADNTIRLSRVSVADTVALACTTAGRNLSREEWQSYFLTADYRRTCRNQPLPSSFRREAAALAQRGEIMAAISIYQRMHKLDPRLTFDPQQEANREFAKTVVISATELARSGEITQAVTAYQQALILDPTLPITPAIEANRQYAPTVVGQVDELARSGEITASLAAISQVIQLDRNVEISGNTWNEICWNGALAGLAAQVVPACEKAVAATPEDGLTRDSRGLARALTNDRDGAIEDFGFAVKWAKETNYREEFITSRQAWIDDLKADKNPFTPAVLQQLR